MAALRDLVFVGFVRYLGKKAIFLVFTLIFALYLTVVIANFGGYVDKLLRDQAHYDALRNCIQDQSCAKSPTRNATIENDYQSIVAARGLNESRTTACLADWRERGVAFSTVDAVLSLL